MPLINVNMLQDGVNYTDVMTSYTDNYIKASLANLGQRTGIKGDGLSIDEFLPLELINEPSSVMLDDSKYVKSIYNYSEHSVTSYLYDIVKDEEIAGTRNITYIDVPYVTENNITINSPSQSNKIYNKGGHIYRDNDNSFYHFKFGVFNSQPTSDGTIYDYIICNKISDSKEPIQAINIYSARSGFKNIIYILTDSGYKEGTNNVYELASYAINETVVSFNRNFNSILEDLKQYKSEEALYKYILENSTFINSYKVLRNTETNSNFALEDGSITEITPAEVLAYGESITVEFLTVLLNERLQNYTYDIIEWFTPLQKVYNDNVFYSNETNNDIKRQILARLIQRIYTCSGSNTNKYEVYFPANYVFKYLVNSNDPSVIYMNNRDINVRLLIITEDVLNNYNVFNGKTIIADGRVDKTIAFDFNVKYFYDEIYNEYIVDSIHSEKIYVLPYVGQEDGYWYFNDINSGIYALGKDAGQPNIIICQTTYSEGSDSVNSEPSIGFKFISGVGTDIIGTSFDTCDVNYKIPKTKDEQSSNITTLKANLPDISNISLEHERLRLLENALIINLIDIRQENIYHAEDDRLLLDIYGGGYATTFWRIDYNAEENVYSYKFVVSPDSSEENEKSYALSINDLGNIENYVKHALNTEYEPDRYAHTFLVFDRIFYGNKQTINDKTVVQPVLRNVDLGSNGDPNDPLERLGNIDNSNSKAQYNNPINFLIEFSSNVVEPNNVSEIRHNDENDRCFNIGKSDIIEYTYQYIENDPVLGPHWERLPIYSYTYILNNVINYDEYAYEFIPNSDIQDLVDDALTGHNDVYPILDTKEVLLRNVNTLNRTNIIGIGTSKKYDGIKDFSGELYYAYLGVSPDSNDRNILKLGTSYQNINLGAATMTDVESTKRMNKFNEFDIDIERTKFNGNVEFTHPIYIDKPVWNTYKITDGDITYYSSTALVHPSGKYSELFINVPSDIKLSRYITEQQVVNPSLYTRYTTYLNVDKLLDDIELKYDNARFIGDVETFDPITHRLELSTYIPDTEILHYSDFTAYTVNPIQITYIDGNVYSSYYIDRVPSYIYSYTTYNSYYSEQWHCDGCEACANAPQCANKRLCKYTWYNLEGFHLNMDGDKHAYNYTLDEAQTKVSTKYYYSYDVAVKEKLYAGDENDYWAYAYAYPEIYSFTYDNVIWPRGDKGTGASYYETSYVQRERFLTLRTINIKEVITSASDPKYNNRNIEL